MVVSQIGRYGSIVPLDRSLSCTSSRFCNKRAQAWLSRSLLEFSTSESAYTSVLLPGTISASEVAQMSLLPIRFDSCEHDLPPRGSGGISGPHYQVFQVVRSVMMGDKTIEAHAKTAMSINRVRDVVGMKGFAPVDILSSGKVATRVVGAPIRRSRTCEGGHDNGGGDICTGRKRPEVASHRTRNVERR